jgi:hypothetical protein
LGLASERRFVQAQTSNFKLQTSNFKLQTANCKLQTANCKLQTANCKLQTANCKLHFAPRCALAGDLLLSVATKVGKSAFYRRQTVAVRDDGAGG